MVAHSSSKKPSSSSDVSVSTLGYKMNHSASMSNVMQGGGGSRGGSGGGGSGDGLEDGDNRTRNAKAQRRHREKRKAHVQALEESVQLLTGQLEDARRQLGQAAYSLTGRIAAAPLSPQSKDFTNLQAENAYLREENADFRRQLYAYRVSYGPIPQHAGQVDGGEVKSEPGGFGMTYGQSSMASPRPGERLRQSGEFDNSIPSTAEGSTSSSSSYPVPQNDPYGRNPRSRVMSSSSAPAASPYVSSVANFSDPRPTSLSGASPSTPLEQRYTPVRYESHMYPPSAPAQPPPHQLPRAGVYDMSHQYRGGGENATEHHTMWGPASGPPPFPGTVNYSLGFGDGQNTEEWRGDH